MQKFRFEILFAAVLLALFLAFAHWQAPGNPLSAAEIRDYLAKLEDSPIPPDEKAAALEHFKAWAEADDGQPVYMLNLMRYLPRLRTDVPGVEGFSGTAEQANAHYEQGIAPVLMRLGVSVMFASEMQGVIAGEQPSTNLIAYEPEVDNWDRVLIVRYPSRRAFLDLVTDPQYQPYVPYKLASVMVALTPMKGDVVLPDSIPGMAAILLILFFAVAWLRALRRTRGQQAWPK
ncbi:hypothetical protein [Pseudomonas sp. N040]|uniref:hypothetical protein n=1 Tax=Pseudomonas sp. N040 TaxID=2785325 RepID=UPI0018A329A0|nr:hypothetical protein [Pseudomonas sp. N040]MBF7729919.1 hypothetical protein [Pseudomonas sp. N040]MBW7013561.1 hypothetical protein [Pseudomonas sp. N040]